MLTLAATLCVASLFQPPGDDLQAVLRAEARRVEVMARVAPAVCSVMQLDAPGGGSGVIFDRLGFVLTNFHVVGKPNVQRMKVGLPDGELYRATVLGVDPGSDLAVLLLDEREEPWPWAPLGDSDALLVGEHCFAMGNPFLLATDFTPTTTWGIVSGTHRYQPGQGNRALVYPDCIQVDVPINPGNSGGPLFNMRGEVVGINGRISVRDRGRVNTGVGFAIASNQIRNFLPDLMAGRFAEHGTLDMNAWFMKAPTGDDRYGVFVQAVFQDSDVMRFGVRLGDELLRFNGTPIRSANQLATLVGVLPQGTWVSLVYRPQLDGGGFGEARELIFPLRRLDTGSSRDEDRLASTEHRARARAALLRNVPREPANSVGAIVTIEGPDDERVVLSRHGDRLRIDYGTAALIRLGANDGFRVEDGSAADLSAEERAKLDRVFTTNPWLWRGEQLLERVADAEFVGGAMVGSRPVFRLTLPGDGYREVWFSLDGSPAGCQYHDPVQKARIQLHALDGVSRVIKDGELADGWSIASASFETPDAKLFERPGNQ